MKQPLDYQELKENSKGECMSLTKIAIYGIALGILLIVIIELVFKH